MSDTINSNQSKNIGHLITSVIKIIDILCFSLAVIFTFFFFGITLPIKSCWECFILIIALFISAIVLKQEIILWFISLLKNKESDSKSKKGSLSKIYKNLNLGTLSLPILRNIVFNVMAQSFPIILLTIVLLLVASFFGYISICPNSWTIIGVVGVLLAIFRFYVNSKQSTAEQTIVSIFNAAQSTIQYYVSHLKFKDWIEYKYGEKDHIVQAVNHIFDTQKDVKKAVDELIRFTPNRKKPSASKGLNIRNLTVYPRSFPDNECFYYELEHSNLVAGKPQNSDLQKYYEAFFLNYCFCEIRNKLLNQFEFREIGRIIVTNINIIDENGASFANITNFTKFWEYIEDENDKCVDCINEIVGKTAEANNKLKTATDYIDELTHQVIKFIFSEILYEYKKDSNN